MTDTMTTVTRDPAVLLALADRVERGEGVRSVLGLACGRLTLTGQQRATIGRFVDVGAYLDAISAFTEAVLPGWHWYAVGANAPSNWWNATLHDARASFIVGAAPTEPAARLSAALRALASEVGRG